MQNPYEAPQAELQTVPHPKKQLRISFDNQFWIVLLECAGIFFPLVLLFIEVKVPVFVFTTGLILALGLSAFGILWGIRFQKTQFWITQFALLLTIAILLFATPH
jgi:hypothetical protein